MTDPQKPAVPTWIIKESGGLNLICFFVGVTFLSWGFWLGAIAVIVFHFVFIEPTIEPGSWAWDRERGLWDTEQKKKDTRR